MQFNPEDVVNARDRFLPNLGAKKTPNIDKLVSKILGQTVMATDPRLINLIVKWKKSKSPDQPDNFFDQEDKVTELKKVFAV